MAVSCCTTLGGSDDHPKAPFQILLISPIRLTLVPLKCLESAVSSCTLPRRTATATASYCGWASEMVICSSAWDKGAFTMVTATTQTTRPPDATATATTTTQPRYQGR